MFEGCGDNKTYNHASPTKKLKNPHIVIRYLMKKHHLTLMTNTNFYLHLQDLKHWVSTIKTPKRS